MALRLSLQIDGDADDAKKALEETRSAIDETGQAADLAGRRMAVGAETGARHFTETTRSAKLTTLQMQNLQFQMQDIAQGILTGQLGFRLLIQQGSQIVQMFGPGVGVGAALRSVGQGVVAFLTNPLNIALVAFSAVTGAATALFSAVVSGGESADDVLKQHEELIGRIRDAWPEATQGVRDYARESLAVVHTGLRDDINQLTRSLGSAAAAVLASTREVQLELVNGVATQVADTATQFAPFQAAITRLEDGIKAGTPDIRAFRAAVASIAETEPENAALQKIAASLFAASDDANKLQSALSAAEQAIHRTGAAARGEAKAVADFGDALKTLAGIAPPHLDDRAQVQAAYQQAVANASGIRDIQVAAAARQRALQRIADEEKRVAAENAARGATSAATSRRIVGATDAETDATKALVATQKEEISQLDRLRGVASNIFTGIANDIRRGASAGETLLDVLNRIADALVQRGAAAFGNLLFGPTGTLGGGLFGGFFDPALVSTSVGVYHAGGEVGRALAPRRTVPLAAVMSAPRFHDGLQPGERFGIFQDGETILPKGRAPNATTVNFYIETPNPRAFAESRASVSRAAGRFLSQVGRHT